MLGCCPLKRKGESERRGGGDRIPPPPPQPCPNTGGGGGSESPNTGRSGGAFYEILAFSDPQKWWFSLWPSNIFDFRNSQSKMTQITNENGPEFCRNHFWHQVEWAICLRAERDFRTSWHWVLQWRNLLFWSSEISFKNSMKFQQKWSGILLKSYSDNTLSRKCLTFLNANSTLQKTKFLH